MSNPTKETAPVKKNPFAVPTGKRALLLVPYEPTQRDQVAELLATEALEEGSPGFPRVVAQIKLLKLTDLDVIFTAVPVASKMGARKQPSNFKLRISAGVAADKFIVNTDEGDGVDCGGVVDAIQPGAHPFSCKMSTDKILKLLEC